ncbi:MAG: glycosyltransferase [Deltaproteobacteria bacterium]|jgi:glycosyltransferase involved in cell wall biosynthesis|nr:glycosyltransferase [Deltaproteobacteria bacterium]
MKEPTLGLLMIARDEASNLPKSLLPLIDCVDQAVFLDTGSQDNGPQIAKKAGAQVYRATWAGDFSLARNAALAKIKTDYVLWLDADNALEPQTLKDFRSKLQTTPTVYLATEKVIPQGDEIWQKRIFPNQPQCRWTGKIHEQLIHPAHYPVTHSQLIIEHWGYQDPQLARLKGERNLRLLLEIDLDKADFYHQYQTGRTLLNLRRPEEARPWLEKAALKNDNLSLASHSLILLAQIDKAAGFWSRAEENLKLLVAKRPDYGPGHYYLGRLWADVKPSLAQKELTLALELGLADPGWGANGQKLGYVAANLLGRLALATGSLAEAEKAFQKAHLLDPGRPEPQLELAALAWAAGRKEEAQQIARRILGQFPGLRAARKLLSQWGQP